MPKFIARLVVNAIALGVAAWFVPGIKVAGSDTRLVINLLIVALIFGIVNAIIKPLLKLVTCPFYILTLGLFTFIVNALMLMFTAWVGQTFVGNLLLVRDFWSALAGSIVISVISTILSLVLINKDD